MNFSPVEQSIFLVMQPLLFLCQTIQFGSIKIPVLKTVEENTESRAEKQQQARNCSMMLEAVAVATKEIK